jgi:hypothetical protein
MATAVPSGERAETIAEHQRAEAIDGCKPPASALENNLALGTSTRATADYGVRKNFRLLREAFARRHAFASELEDRELGHRALNARVDLIQAHPGW